MEDALLTILGGVAGGGLIVLLRTIRWRKPPPEPPRRYASYQARLPNEPYAEVHARRKAALAEQARLNKEARERGD